MRYGAIELMQGVCSFPIIIDNFWKIICVGHFECIITVAHNTLIFISRIAFFSGLNMNYAINTTIK